MIMGTAVFINERRSQADAVWHACRQAALICSMRIDYTVSCITDTHSIGRTQPTMAERAASPQPAATSLYRVTCELRMHHACEAAAAGKGTRGTLTARATRRAAGAAAGGVQAAQRAAAAPRASDNEKRKTRRQPAGEARRNARAGRAAPEQQPHA